jgi:NADPH:quinone reductase-like Zn-dependent oxidoreductase
MIRGVRIYEFGGPQVRRIEEVEAEEPGAGEVRIRIRAMALKRLLTEGLEDLAMHRPIRWITPW